MATQIAIILALLGVVCSSPQFIEGGSVKLSFTDCGDSSTHGHITGLTPAMLPLGKTTTITGTGNVDEAVSDGTYHVKASVGPLPVLSHSGDACKADTIKFPAGVGQIVFKGFSCPLQPGKVSLDLDTTISGSVPSKLARVNIQLTAQSSSGDKLLCVNVKTSPGEEEPSYSREFMDAYVKSLVSPSFVNGGSVKLSFSDCGDSSTHGHITGLTPAMLPLGKTTTITGTGNVDEAVSDGTYHVKASVGPLPVLSHSGDACKADTIKFPAGVGQIVFKGFSCPLQPGKVSLDLDTTISGSVPSKLARVNIQLTAHSSSGDKLLCVNVKTSPGEEDPEHVVV